MFQTWHLSLEGWIKKGQTTSTRRFPKLNTFAGYSCQQAKPINKNGNSLMATKGPGKCSGKLLAIFHSLIPIHYRVCGPTDCGSAKIHDWQHFITSCAFGGQNHPLSHRVTLFNMNRIFLLLCHTTHTSLHMSKCLWNLDLMSTNMKWPELHPKSSSKKHVPPQKSRKNTIVGPCIVHWQCFLQSGLVLPLINGS